VIVCVCDYLCVCVSPVGQKIKPPPEGGEENNMKNEDYKICHFCKMIR